MTEPSDAGLRPALTDLSIEGYDALVELPGARSFTPRQVREHHFDCHLAIQLGIGGFEDGGHAATTEFTLDLIAVSEGSFQSFQ